MLKAAEKREFAKRIQDSLAKRPEVRPFPAAVTQLLAACQDPNANAQNFEAIIECDPALAVRVLRMANSPVYGLARDIGSIRHATSILGIRQLKNLALSVAGGAMFAVGESASEPREALWHHSLGCAAVARILAKESPGASSDTAFLAGVFHDVGKLLLLDVAAEEYTRLAAVHTGSSLVAEEGFMFGIGHQEIGLKSAHAWGLPEEVKAAIGYHHCPEEAPAHGEFVTHVYVANRLARAWGIGSEVADDSNAMTEVAAQLDISDQALADLQEPARLMFYDVVRAMA